MKSWLQDRRSKVRQESNRIAFADSQEWQLIDGCLRHKTDGFFIVEGLRARARDPLLDGRQQPIINQAEIGILGFLVAQTDSGFMWMAQAKHEPGNVGAVQLAPTVQATYSNYTRRHGGAPTHFLDLFLSDDGKHSDCLQSEQGTRFKSKFNRNVVVEVAAETPPANDSFGWFGADDVKQALLEDFCINTDARSVIATAPWRLLGSGGHLFAGRQAHAHFGDRLARSYARPVRPMLIQTATAAVEKLRGDIALSLEICGLDELDDWKLTPDSIESRTGAQDILVEHFEVFAPGREVERWDQPLVRSLEEDEVTLLCQEREGTLMFLLRPAFEVGLTGGVEVGASFKRECADTFPSWMAELVEGATTLLDVRQSDEGGRFMESRCRYRVAALEAGTQIPDEESNLWVTASELEQLCRHPKLVTNEGRSVTSTLLGLA